MAKITPFGQPANEGERDAIYYLRRLPDTFEIFHNLEIRQNKEIFEVDLVILGPQCVFVVDVKGTHGRIEVIGSRWYPENRQAYASPVAKLRNIAKVLNTLIKESSRMKPELGQVHIHAATLMIAEDVEIIDLDRRDSDYITYCDERCIRYFQSRDFIPDHRLTDIRAYHADIKRALQGKARSKSSPPRYRDWQVEEELGRTDRYIEYRARHLLMGASGWTARLRVYRIDPYQDRAAREAEQKLISNAFQAVYQVPKHPNILNVQEFFAAEDGDCFVLVTEDIPGQPLRQHVKKQNITLEQKFELIGAILITLDHVHKHGVIHRNLTPDNILIGVDGQIRLIGFDYARIVDRTSTIAYDIVDELETDAIYQATECYRDPAKASAASDLFSAGLVFYELLTGKQAFESAEQICDRMATFPTQASALQPDLAAGIDAWLQKLCAFYPTDRFQSADVALQEVTPLATLQTLDLANLPVDSPIDERFRVIQRLGHPGSFAVAYKVLDTLDDTVVVLKLVTRDRRSVYERLRQEYKTLRQVPQHPHIVKVIFAGHLKDDTPFIIFEYVQGLDVEQLLAEKALLLEDAIQIAQQTAIGLAHLHQHGVYHQDIKPSNLFWTDTGIRIIDFNIAVSDGDEMTISAGTRKYLPPDFKPKAELTKAEKIDRDLYALGITFYECVAGSYPFDEPNPPFGRLCRNPNEVGENTNLSDELVGLLTKAIAPKKADRFSSATEFLEALASIESFQKTEVELAEEIEQLSEEKSREEIEPEAPLVDVVPNNVGIINQPPAKTIESPVENTSLAQEEAEPEVEQIEVPTSQLHKAEAEAKYSQVVTSGAIAAESTKQTSLFDNLPPISPPESLLDTEKAQGKFVVLDLTGLYSPPPGCIEIRTEADWIRYFFQSEGLYWVTGRGLQANRLCDWTREWLRVWNKLSLIVEEKQNPRSRLNTLLGSVSIPEEWTEDEILKLAAALDAYPSDNPVAHLLADLTEGDCKNSEFSVRQVWFGSPSIQNLAQWLSIQLPETYRPLERIWQDQMARSDSELSEYYQTPDKLQLLRQWTGIIKPLARVKALGRFPLPVPKALIEEFRSFWERQFLRNEGRALDELAPNQQSGMEQIASLAYNILKNRPDWITRERKRKLSSYLNYPELRDLDSLQPPPQPEPLDLNASAKDAMQWATEQYLPFRRWDAAINPSSERPRISDRLAKSFVDWLIKSYPELRFDNSVLNYGVAALIQDFCQEGPVLWVVIDGLGWLDHQELLSYLTRNSGLSIETALQPRISILPTKTEYAKWSLYTQLPPSHSTWVPDAGKGFPMMGIGKRYTDRDYKRGTLHKDLRQNAYQLYCWDTDKFDHLYHTEQDWQNLYQVQRPYVLEWLARNIEYCIKQHPHPEQLRVVVASDHGQMLGEAEQLTNRPEDLDLKGRMAIGKTDDPRFVVLDAERYGLPHDISIVKGPASLNAFSHTEKNEIIGSHGGLFPEEVVIGVSVLRQVAVRLAVQAICQGEGEPGKPGALILTVKNLNTVPLTQLCLSINELPALKAGYAIEETIPAGQEILVSVPLSSFPELPPSYEGNQLALTGELRFQFADLESGIANLDVESHLIVKQIFRSGLDIDEFL